MPRPTSTRHSGRVFDTSIASTSSCADRSPMRSSGTSLLDRERVDVGRVLEQAGVDELAHPFLAEPFDVERAATRPVHEPLHALRRAVDVDAVVVRLALDAHERLRRTPGTSSGTSTACVLRRPLGEHRPDDLGDHVAGAAHDDRVARAARPCARRRPRCAASPCRRSRRRRTPARAPRTASARPVRPMLTMMSRRIVVFSSGGNLYAIAHRGARDVKPISARCAEVVDLHDDAVDLVAERVPVRLHLARRTRNTASRSSNASMCGFTGKPSSSSHASVSWCVRSRGPPSCAPSW